MMHDRVYPHSLMNFNPMSDPQARLVQEASDWFARLHAEHVTGDDHAAFARWKDQHPANGAAYESVSELWESIGRVDLQEHIVDLKQFDPPPDVRRPWRSRQHHFMRMAAVAALMAAVVVGAGIWGPDLFQRWQSDYATSSGEQRHVRMTDGSTLLLNTQTALALHPNANIRGILLLKGEAAFAVASDPDKPFIVKAGPGEIRVVGTKFSVRKRPERVTVTVNEGTVTVAGINASSSVRVEAGEEISYDENGLGPVVKADLLKALAWQRGQLVFTLEPLKSVIEELNRYHPGAIILADHNLDTRTVSGVFATDDPMRVVSAIIHALHVDSFSMADRIVFLY
ncbi:MAG: FecR family protein [Nitrospira sp.]